MIIQSVNFLFLILSQDFKLLSLVDIDFDVYRRKIDMKTVRRNVTLPNWLNREAEEAHINVSKVLQEALMTKLGVNKYWRKWEGILRGAFLVPEIPVLMYIITCAKSTKKSCADLDCPAVWSVLYSDYGAIVLQGGWPLFLHRMGVVLMDKKPFDFKDLMAFGMFVLALLTFVFTFCR